MLLGADLLNAILSLQGVVFFIVAAALWIGITGSRAARRFLYLGAIVYLIASLDGVPTLAGKWLSAGYRPFQASDLPRGGRTVIVVLGAGSNTVGDWWGNNYSVAGHSSLQRALEAAHVYSQTHADYVISSGGEPHPSRHRAPAGDTMRAALLALGVPADRILVETRSLTTHDEANIVNDMLKPLHVDHIVLVTSQSHMRRAMGTFRAVGLHCIPAVAAEFDFGDEWWVMWLPTQSGLEDTSAIAHEVAGFVYYGLRGWWVR